jgi:hypothetical protein
MKMSSREEEGDIDSNGPESKKKSVRDNHLTGRGTCAANVILDGKNRL